MRRHTYFPIHLSCYFPIHTYKHATLIHSDPNLWWLVRSGQCNFWFDNWLGSGLLCQRLQSVSDHLVADVVVSGQWNLQLLRRWVPNDIVAEIITKLAPTGSTDDSAVWALTESGIFRLLLPMCYSAGRHRLHSCLTRFGILWYQSRYLFSWSGYWGIGCL